MNRLAAKQWADHQREQEAKEARAKRIADDLEALGRLRAHLLQNNHGEPTQKFRAAIDDYAGFLTGDRQALWSKDCRAIHPDNRGTNPAYDT